jgi:hypothetical protein
MYRTNCENAKLQDCTECRFYRLPQLPLDVTAVTGLLDDYTAEVGLEINFVYLSLKKHRLCFSGSYGEMHTPVTSSIVISFISWHFRGYYPDNGMGDAVFASSEWRIVAICKQRLKKQWPSTDHLAVHTKFHQCVLQTIKFWEVFKWLIMKPIHARHDTGVNVLRLFTPALQSFAQFRGR